MPAPPRGGEDAILQALKLLDEPADPVTGARPWNFITASVATGCDRYTLSRRFRKITMAAEDATYLKNTLLSKEQEKALVRWLLFVDDWGFPSTYNLIQQKALALAKERNSTIEEIGVHWVSRFLNRPVAVELKARFSNSKDRNRQKAQSPEVIRDFFLKWKGVIEKYGIRPEDIYNFDEKGVMIGQTGREWVVTRRDRKTAYAIQDGSRESVTIVEAIRGGVISETDETPASQSTPPHLLPPFIITAGQTYTTANFKYILEKTGGGSSILAGATFCKSPKGYTSNEMNLKYFVKHLGPITKKLSEGRVRLFSMDGHGSHVTLEVIEYCIENNIHLMCFPAHLTHMMQPLDVGVFGPLQRAYDKKAKAWIRDPTNGRMSLACFFLLYHHAREETILNKMVASAFRGTGLFPIDVNQVLGRLPTTPIALEASEIIDPAQVVQPFNPLSTPRNDKTMQNIFLASRNPLNTSKLQLQTLVETAVKGGQAAMADRDMLKKELQDLRLANANKPEEAFDVDVRSRRYGEEVTSEEVVVMRRVAIEERRQQEQAKEERRVERERRAEERKVEEKAKEERRVIRERKAEERKLEEVEKQRKAEERQLKKQQDKEEKELKKQQDKDEKELKRQQEKEERESKRLADEAQALANNQLRNDLKTQKTTRKRTVVTTGLSFEKSSSSSFKSSSSVGNVGGAVVRVEEERLPSRIEEEEEEVMPQVEETTRSTRSGRQLRPQYWKGQDLQSSRRRL